ncbi:MAG TPA: ABC transporter substrate-binding protein [Microbacteriaceae bacterium]|nr:ABC transporter substrate-binding protein [Microbacteriaceae bacterium]
MKHKFKVGLVVSVTAMLFLSSCVSEQSQSGDNKSKETIKIGAVSSITGPYPFPEVPAAAAAVFDRVNDSGGIQGRLIEFISEDDGADPAIAAQAGRRLVDEVGVVALSGSASMVDCTTNGTFYTQNNVMSLTGTGVEGTCFEMPNIAPVNNGSIQNFASLLQFSATDLEADNVCAVILTVPGLTDAYLEVISDWEANFNKKIALVDTSVIHGEDPTPAILATKNADCDAVIFNSNEPVAAAFMNAVKNQNMLDSSAWLTISAAYTDSAIGVLNKQNSLGLYVGSEFVPFTTDDPALSQWRKTLTEANVPLTSLSIGGYVSAELLVDAIKSINGPITRESVTEALRSPEGFNNELLGEKFLIGDAEAHNPNTASMVVQANADGWEVVSNWIFMP